MRSHAGAWERRNKYRLNLVPTLLRGNAYHTCSMLLLTPPLLEKLHFFFHNIAQFNKRTTTMHILSLRKFNLLCKFFFIFTVPTELSLVDRPVPVYFS